eukprot:CAMPEP_0202454818 /NCGR_PEP_ID=MMETSP1360-20130828/12465_1 /ASSEMBLY_ACC=CAM_ASM_000848 /TAXON_ID=515479 /ORGANISM="Licmophora paradoxa, Strain CCMP2313" /LENGTH=704 /DNA_ID=CAMNT_0049074229 /DNA_START=92 /DNA_END=2203 /DNA_ORIENTATION=+
MADCSSILTELSPLIDENKIEVCVRIGQLPIASKTTNHHKSSTTGSHSQGRRSVGKPRKVKENPPSSSKSKGGSKQDACCWKVIEHDTVRQTEKVPLSSGRRSSYTVDHVYGPDASTKKLYYHSVKPAVEASLQGDHASVFAYGMSATGKTFTMTGTLSTPGVIPLAVQDLFQYIQRGVDGVHREYLIRLSYLEIYNEQIIDLLTEQKSTKNNIRLLASEAEGTLIQGCREQVIASPSEAFHFLKRGEERLHVSSTTLNKRSSRSHTVVRFLIESYCPSETATFTTSLNFVDLAGYDSIRSTGISAKRGKEGQFINKSLSTLGQVIHNLQGKSHSHIPYRNSKLTRLLQPSLSGSARLVLICTISPFVNKIEESHNSLNFAIRTKRLQQRTIADHHPTDNSKAGLLQSYKEELQGLKQQLLKSSAPQAIQTSNGSLHAEDVKDLAGAIREMERFILKTKCLEETTKSVEEVAFDQLLNRSIQGSAQNPELQPSSDDQLLVNGLRCDEMRSHHHNPNSSILMTPPFNYTSARDSEDTSRLMPDMMPPNFVQKGSSKYFDTPPTSPDQSPIQFNPQTPDGLKSLFLVSVPSELTPKVIEQPAPSPPVAKQADCKPIISSTDDSTANTITSQVLEDEKASINRQLEIQMTEKLSKEVENLREQLRAALTKSNSTESRLLAREASSLRGMISNLESVRKQEREDYDRE